MFWWLKKIGELGYNGIRTLDPCDESSSFKLKEEKVFWEQNKLGKDHLSLQTSQKQSQLNNQTGGLHLKYLVISFYPTSLPCFGVSHIMITGKG